MKLPPAISSRVKSRLWLTGLFTAYFLLTCWAGSSICFVRSATGLPCPGCGLTTAGLALLRGDFGAAFKANAMIFIVVLVMPLAIFDIVKKNPAFSKYTRWLYLGAAAMMLIYFAVRMILYFPHGDHPMNIDDHTIPRKVFSLFN